ncbi:MAG TPA: DUF1080 domain-containing protein [Pirellulaceae bacterium]|jgi:hypothetical protein|nr:DUF1080 domain-containing protein [Pirellulaceae bacterium]
MKTQQSCFATVAILFLGGWVLSSWAAFTTTNFAAEASDEQGFVPLFNGASLAGWEGNLNIFRVENRAVVAGSKDKPVANNEFLCTKKQFGDFELRLKAKLVGQGKNAGIQFRSKRIPNHHEVIGYQCDMGISGADHVIWGALYDESRRRKFLAEGDQKKLTAALKADDWNDFVIRCEGPRIQIWLNGYQAVDYTEAEDVPRIGVIALQIHGGKPAVASYKDIRIKELPANQ